MNCRACYSMRPGPFQGGLNKIPPGQRAPSKGGAGGKTQQGAVPPKGVQQPLPPGPKGKASGKGSPQSPKPRSEWAMQADKVEEATQELDALVQAKAEAEEKCRKLEEEFRESHLTLEVIEKEMEDARVKKNAEEAKLRLVQQSAGGSSVKMGALVAAVKALLTAVEGVLPASSELGQC